MKPRAVARERALGGSREEPGVEARGHRDAPFGNALDHVVPGSVGHGGRAVEAGGQLDPGPGIGALLLETVPRTAPRPWAITSSGTIWRSLCRLPTAKPVRPVSGSWASMRSGPAGT